MQKNKIIVQKREEATSFRQKRVRAFDCCGLRMYIISEF